MNYIQYMKPGGTTDAQRQNISKEQLHALGSENFKFLEYWYANRPMGVDMQSMVGNALEGLKKVKVYYHPNKQSQYDHNNKAIIIGDDVKPDYGSMLLQEMTHSVTQHAKDAAGESTPYPIKNSEGSYTVYNAPYYGIASSMVPNSLGNTDYFGFGKTQAEDNIKHPNFYNDSTKLDLSKQIQFLDTAHTASKEEIDKAMAPLKQVSHDDQIAEQYGRLMQFRKANNIDPTKTTWTLEEIEKLRNNPQLKDFNIFNRYSNQYIKDMFNLWAYNPQNLTSSSNIHYAKSGGTIKIKKKNIGSFTRYCNGKVTEECIRKGKNSSNPTTRKRANFAWVARHKFKHEEGGKLNYLNYFN